MGVQKLNIGQFNVFHEEVSVGFSRTSDFWAIFGVLGILVASGLASADVSHNGPIRCKIVSSDEMDLILMLGILVGQLLIKCRAEESDTRVRFLLNLCYCAEKATRLREWRPELVCASRLRIIQLVLTVFFITVLPSSTLVGQPRAVEAEIAFTELLRVGEETDENAYLFGRIVSLAVDSKDRILVADRQPPSVSVFSVDGEWLGSVGGKGDGPGEYVEVNGVYVSPSDTVYVMDGRNGYGPPRLHVYDPTDFTYVRQIQFPVEEEPRRISSVAGVSDHGPIVQYNTVFRPSVVGKPRHSSAILMSWIGEQIRELARLPDMEIYVGLLPNGRPFVQEIKFFRGPRFRLSASQLLYSGWTAEIDILVTSLADDSVRTIQRPHDPVPVTRDEIPEGLDAEVRKMYPEFKPAYRYFVIDDQDNIWIKDYVEATASEARWQVLDSDGRMIGQVLLPNDLVLSVIDTADALAYGYRRGESGEYLLVVYSVDF